MSPQQNHLLSDLPADESGAFARHLKQVLLHKGQVLLEAGEVPRHVCFPVGAMVSMLNDSRDGDSLETYMFGKTCMVGVATVGQPSFYRAQVRSAGTAYQLSVSALEQLRRTCPTYSRHAVAALNRMVMQLSQDLVCGKRHVLEQQLIRWMLSTLDRCQDACIPITHQELSEILGVRREAVTLKLKTMVEREEITLRRGWIKVLDRQALEARVCECYWLVQPGGRVTGAQSQGLPS